MTTGAMNQAIARLTQEVTDMNTVAESAATLLHGLGTIIRQNASNPPALQALADQLDAKEQELKQAVTDNTIAAEEPTQPEQPANPTA